MDYDEIIEFIRSSGHPKNVAGMARYGINPKNNYGVSITRIREIAKEVGVDHKLAVRLWDSGIHDARLMAPLVAEPEKANSAQIEKWVSQIDSWDICDNLCGGFFQGIDDPYGHAEAWCRRDEEFVKRAGFVLVARLAVKDKKADDARFEYYFPLIVSEAVDERNMVKKGVNWALRQIGKRNMVLNRKAIELALKIDKLDSKSARWIAKDALRELRSEKVQARLAK